MWIPYFVLDKEYRIDVELIYAAKESALEAEQWFKVYAGVHCLASRLLEAMKQSGKVCNERIGVLMHDTLYNI